MYKIQNGAGNVFSCDTLQKWKLDFEEVRQKEFWHFWTLVLDKIPKITMEIPEV